MCKYGVIGFMALMLYLTEYPYKKGFFLETAHPVKFSYSVERITGYKIPVPGLIKPIMLAEKKSTVIKADYDAMKAILLNQ